MTSFLVLVVTAVLVVAAALQIAGKRAASCWLLVPFPTLSCFIAIADLSQGTKRIGGAAFENDLKQLAFLTILLLLSLGSALRSKWSCLFWIVWLAISGVLGIVVYLEFLWKVFS
jgi:hypothetical protein